MIIKWRSEYAEVSYDHRSPWGPDQRKILCISMQGFLRKDSESTHFLSEHLICSNQHPGDRKFHHLLHMCITCITRNSWLKLQRSKCLVLITGINGIFVGLQSGPRSRHAQTQFMVIPQNCELRRFLFIEPKWVHSSFQDASNNSLLCFSFPTKSKTNNSPITADTARINSLLDVKSLESLKRKVILRTKHNYFVAYLLHTLSIK